MTVYLSNHWRINNVLTSILIVCYFLIYIYIRYLNSIDDTFYNIAVFISLTIPVTSVFYIKKKAIKPIMKKVMFNENKITMISSNKKNVTIDLNNKVYFKKLKLIVGKYNSQVFVLISNEQFELLESFTGLGQVCKFIDKLETVVIVPYNNKTAPFLKNIE